MLPVPLGLAYQPGMPPACLPEEKHLTKLKKQGGNLSPYCQKWKKKKVKKGWIWQRVVSWTNSSSHRFNNIKAWGFQRCLAALEDVTPNFKQHLIYSGLLKTLPFTIRHQPKASLLFWNMCCLCVDSSPAINHIPQALETTSPVCWASTVPCNEFHHSKFLSSWNQLMLFFSLIKATY